MRSQRNVTTHMRALPNFTLEMLDPEANFPAINPRFAREVTLDEVNSILSDLETLDDLFPDLTAPIIMLRMELKLHVFPRPLPPLCFKQPQQPRPLASTSHLRRSLQLQLGRTEHRWMIEGLQVLRALVNAAGSFSALRRGETSTS